MFEDYIKKHHLGLEVYANEHLDKVLELKPDFVIVTLENRYLKDISSLVRKNQKAFYESLFERVKDIPIIFELPHIQRIYQQFVISEDPIFDLKTMENYHNFYDEELDLILSLAANHITIILNNIQNPISYKEIKKYLKTKADRFNKKISLGLEIDSEELYDNHFEYPKFDFGILELEQVFYDIFDDPIEEGAFYLKTLTQFRYELRRRSKPLILTGESLKDKNTFNILLKRGFKNFIVDEFRFKLYKKMIDEYNMKRNQICDIEKNT